MRHERDGSGLRGRARALPWRWIAAGAALLAGIAMLPLALGGVIGAQVRRAAEARQLQATWTRLEASYPAQLRLEGLTLTGAAGDTVLAAAETRLSLAFAWPLRIASLRLRDASLALPSAADSSEDAGWAPEPDAGAARGTPVDPRVRAATAQIAEAVLMPARRLPEMRLERVRVRRGDRGVEIDALEVTHGGARFQLSGVGTLLLDEAVPFEAHASWNDDDRFGAQARFTLHDKLRGEDQPLALTLDGTLIQDRAAGTLRLAEGSAFKLGSLRFQVQGLIDRRGPRFEGSLAAEGLSAESILESTPRVLLGPLDALRVAGTFDWKCAFALDVSQPDSVRFDATTVPRGLAIAPDSQLPLAILNGPFIARIHAPGGTVTRELSPANPHYRPLASIAPELRDAVLTNEDGGFWWHRGFNTQAIRLAIAENLRAGRFKRGAGTVTMQLARNLYLGQQKTLARKGQEVVLAWSLEHLARIPKERLIEIYLNIIEWGPGVHGADEAARYYFGKSAGELGLDESLFLATLVPSPRRWRGRLTPDGALRPSVRAQMRFIAGKMNSKGWLDSTEVIPADSLSIALAGPAAALFAPRDTASAAVDSAKSAPSAAF